MKRFFPVFFALLLGTLLLSCGRRTVTLGVMVPITGSAVEYGQSIRRGMEMALQEINQNGGVQGFLLEVEIRDSGQSLAELEAATLELADDLNVPVIFGPVTSGSARTVLQSLGDRSVVVLSPSATRPDLCTQGGWFFRNYPGDDHEGQVMAEAALKEGLEGVVVVTAKSPYGLGMRRAFSDTYQAKGGIVRGQYTLDKDPEKQVALARALAVMRPAPEALFLVGYDHQVAALITAYVQAGGRSRLLTVSSVSTENFVTQAGEAAQGIIYARPPYDPDSGLGPAVVFVEKFKETYGEKPDIYAAHAYDAMHILARAMENGVRPQFIREGLLTQPAYQGVTGMTSFLANGDVKKPYHLWTIDHGVARRYKRKN